MKCTVDNAQLVRVLGDLQKVIPAKPANSSQKSVLAKVSGGTLTLQASDGEISLASMLFCAPGAEEGATLLSAENLLSLVRNLPAGSTTIDADLSCATISWESGHSTVPAFPVEDFVVRACPSGDVTDVAMSPSDLLSALEGTAYATAKDDSRMVLGGVCFDFSPSGTNLVGSDAMKLVIRGVDSNASSDSSFILHRRACAVLKAILPKADPETPVKISFDKASVSIVTDGYLLTSALIAAKYPNYRSIIPSMVSSVITVGRRQLADMVERCATCADRAQSLIRLSFTRGSVGCQAHDLGYGLSAQDSMLVDYEGDDLTIGFNATNLIDVLDNLTANTLRICVQDERRAVLIIPSDEEESIAEKAVLIPLAIAA